MKSTTKMTVAAAAMAGLFAGSAARAATTPFSDSARVTTATHQSIVNAKAGTRLLDSTTQPSEKHDCKGMNSCKGQGGCKTGDNGCKGLNSCKGKGGCKVTGSIL